MVCQKEVVEIVSSKVNKSTSIDIIRDLENISTKDVYTIGDDYNDIEMIKNFNGYAMENAVDELKKICCERNKKCFRIDKYS